ncbi:MAG: hypothetical protein CVT66_09185 [Actinobacteria bacterium HGW-Actinobacteria-6]|nr:MAG: hypothetical protein CVT66_09185 [Actinobacteria bacterium HGW-Actinobacteria-6]
MRRRLFAYVLVLVLCVPMVALARGGSGDGGTPPPADPIVVPVDPVVEPEPTSDAPTDPGRGNSEPGVEMGILYGDLYVIVRDLNGVPVLYSWVWSEDGTTPLYPVEDPHGFSQPIAYDPDGVLPVEFLGLVPLDVEGLVPEAYAVYTQPVDFGRLSLARAPSDVIDQAYAEALAAINACDSIGLDPAGRLLLMVGDEAKAIDSPRECLALYRELMLNGYLSGLTRDAESMGPLAYLCEQGGGSEMTNADLDRAACLLAGSGDKGANVSLDEVIYVNNFLGINDPSTGTYFPFTGMGYTYRRTNAYAGVEAALLQGPVTGSHAVMFYVDEHVNIMDKVFENQGYESVEAGAREFAHAADDSLHVIEYIHNWALPEYE